MSKEIAQTITIIIALFSFLLPPKAISQQLEVYYWTLPGEAEKFIKYDRYWTYVDCETKNPSYVAYSLNFKDTEGPKMRKDNWIPDTIPICPLADEKDYDHAYKKSTAEKIGMKIDKGHLCPAASSRYSQKENDQSFFFSNRAPQNRNFNRNRWKKLEKTVRSYAKKFGIQGIVVYTGVAYDKNMAIKTVGNGVKVPTHFWKIIATVDNNYKTHTLAWIFKNKRYTSKENKDMKGARTSIDNIEKLTGLDFFSDLEPKEEEIIEVINGSENKPDNIKAYETKENRYWDNILGIQNGCCSHHKGYCGCSGDKALCCDGTTSKECTCEK